MSRAHASVRSNERLVGRWPAIGVALLLSLAQAIPVSAADPPEAPGGLTGTVGYYHPVSPSRILDTRTGTGGHSSPIGANASISVDVTGKGGVPNSGVSAVVLNITAVGPTKGTYLTVYPSGEARPLASNLNVAAGQVIPNLVVVKVGSNGFIRIYNAIGSTNVIADVAGWYDDTFASFPALSTGATEYTSVSPARILDTRSAQPIGADRSITVHVAGQGGVPSTGVTAVVLNVTAVQPTRSTYLTVFPAGESKPLASNLNVAAGKVVPNLVVAKVGSNGNVRIYNFAGSTDVIVDVAGWFGPVDGVLAGGEYSGVSPSRILDTRTGTGGVNFPIAANASIAIKVIGKAGVPSEGVSAVVLNITAVAPTKGTYLTVYPAGETRPLASNLNAAAGQIVPNLVVVKIGSNGFVRIYNASGSTHVIADIAGWYATDQAASTSTMSDLAATGETTRHPITGRALDGSTAAVHESPMTLAETAAYWTPERVAEAIGTARPRAVPEHVGSSGGDIAAVGNDEELWVHSHDYYADGSQHPQVGRLVFHIPTSHVDIRGDSVPASQNVCSGTLVARNLVLTAAHCVVSRAITGENIWFDDFIFIPGQYENTAPHGNWTSWEGTVAPGDADGPWFTWLTNMEDNEVGNYFPADYAFVQFGPVDGVYPGDDVGYLGLSIGPFESWVKDSGYPADDGFAQSCTAPGLPDGSAWTNSCYPFYTWTHFQEAFEHDPDWFEVGVGSWMTGGSSGGPMFTIVDGEFHVASVNSNGFSQARFSDGEYWGMNMWGPWFNDYTFDLYDAYAIP